MTRWKFFLSLIGLGAFSKHSTPKPKRGDVLLLPFVVETVTQVDDAFDCGLISLDHIPARHKMATLPEELRFNALVSIKGERDER